MQNKRLLIFFFSLCLFFINQTIFPQASGKIAGKITDADNGEPIPFANVFVEGTTLGAAADFDGNYVILNIPSGLYSVTASVVGFQRITVSDVRVNVDFTTRLDFKLSTGAFELDAVVVQGDRNPLIRQDLTNPTVSINAESIQELPVDQISDIIKLQAGVVTGNDGTIHVRGGRSNEIAFTLNGISLNDPYGNTSSIGIATNAVQEVSVSTGTFSAQYGNALSGVVNYVTKEGPDKYTFSLRGYAGDYFSSRSNLFRDIDKIDILNRGRSEATFGGPIPGLKDGRFYLSGVYENFKGIYVGERLYLPTDSYLSPDNFSGTDTRRAASSAPYFFNPYDINSLGLPSGDGAVEPMNFSRSLNLQGNFSYKFSPTLKLKYELVYDYGKSKAYERAYTYNPDGLGSTYSDGMVHAVDFTHTVDQNVFYTLKFSTGYNNVKYYLYENLDDPRYLPSIYSRPIGNTIYLAGGTDNWRSFRTTTTHGIKGDLVAQLFKIHEVKFGFEMRLHELKYEGYSVQVGKLTSNGLFDANITNSDLLYDSNLVLIRQKPTSPSQYANYLFKPKNFSAYIQDKIEFESSFIVNAGLRYEYFDPAAQYNAALSQNLTDSLFGFMNAALTESKIKQTLSPRLSMSYPITDRAIIRLSYGHFYQIGSLASLYQNHQFFVTNVGSTPTFGNPNVEPQKSIQYEIGLQQQLTDDFKMDITGFYKDVRNYIYTQTIFTETGRQYNLLSNLSYANSRGITLSFLKRRAPGSLFSASLDYTFSISEGNRTEPAEELFFSEQSGKLTETYLVALGFDRAHVINGTVSLTDPANWNLGFVFNLQTGTPYTPSLPSNLVQIRYEQNSARQPINWNVDVKFEKYFTFGPINYTLFLQIENLFDTENERYVYASSGRALSNVEQIQNPYEFSDIRRRIERGDAGLFGIDQVDNYYSQRPERVSRPREVRLGFSIILN